MAQNITTIDLLISANNITEDTNFLVTQYTNSDKTTRLEYNINYKHLSSLIYNEVYGALSGLFSNFLLTGDKSLAIENNVYKKLSSEFLKRILNKASIGQQELLSSATVENIINAINNALTAKIDKENAYTKTDIDNLYRRIITVEDYLSSSSLAKDNNITEIFDDDTGLNEKSTLLLVNPLFTAESDLSTVTSLQEYSDLETLSDDDGVIIESDDTGAFISNFQYKPEVKTLTLQALIDYIKGKIPDMQTSYDSSNVTNTYYNSERLMHFRDNEYSFTTVTSGLISSNDGDGYRDYKTSSLYVVANTEEELMINFDVPVAQTFNVSCNAYAAILVQINHIDNNDTDTKKWVNVVKKSLRLASNTTCSLQTHIIADKGMAIRGYVSTGSTAVLNVNSIKYSMLNIDTLVEKENYIGNDPFPVNYTSYIYANDFNRKVTCKENKDLNDLNNFTEELNRVKIFGPATWLTAYVNQKITDLNLLTTLKLSCDYNLKISYTGTASTKNTIATVRCALLNMDNDDDKALLSNIIKYKYGERQEALADYYSLLKWFNLGFNYIYTNTAHIGEVLLGQYYFPDNVYVVLDLGLNKATTQDTCIKIEYKHGHYTNEDETFEAGNEFIDINTIKSEIFNDNSLTARISYELSTERCPNLSAVRTLSYGLSILSVPNATNVSTATVKNNANFKLLTGYSYIRNNEKISSDISSGVYIPNNVGIGLMNNVSRKQFTFTNKLVPGGYFGLSCDDDRITGPLSSIDGILYGFAEKFITLYVKGKVYLLSIQDCIDTLLLNNYATTVKEFLHIESIRLNKGLTSLGNFCFTYCNMLSSIDFGNAQVAKVPTCFAHISYNKNLSNYPLGANILLNKNVSSIANHINYDSNDSIKADLQRIIIPSLLTANGSLYFCTKIPQVSALSTNIWLSNIVPEIDVILPETFNTFNDTVENAFSDFIKELNVTSRTNIQLSDFTRTNVSKRDDYFNSLTSKIEALSGTQIEAISSAMANLKTNLYISRNKNLNNVSGYKTLQLSTYYTYKHYVGCPHPIPHLTYVWLDSPCVSTHLLRANDRSYTGLIAVYYDNKVHIGTINNAISDIVQSNHQSAK